MLESCEIIHRLLPVVIPEYLFIDIAEQVKRFDADIGSLQSTLEQRPEVLHSVCVDLPIDILLGMIDDLVGVSLIGQERIGVDFAAGFYISADMSLKVVLSTGRNYVSTNLAAALQNADHGNLILGSSLSDAPMVLVAVHESGRATDEGFIYLNLTTLPANFQKRAVLHCKPDAVKHEPCRLLSDAEIAGDFVGANPVLAVGNHPHCDKPFVQRDRRILKDSPDLRSELPMMMYALALS